MKKYINTVVLALACIINFSQMQAANKTSFCPTNNENTDNEDTDKKENLKNGFFLIKEPAKQEAKFPILTNQCLLAAAEEGDLEQLKELFNLNDKKLNINCQETMHIREKITSYVQYLPSEKVVTMSTNGLIDVKKNHTALHKAVFGSHLDVVEFLLEKQADPNIADKEGNTPLHLAIKIFVNKKFPFFSESAEFSIIELLINNNANIDAKNAEGETPLDYAKNTSNKELIDLFPKKEWCFIS